MFQNYKSKLRELRDANPDFASAIEAKFPEIKDREPYLKHGDFFMRSENTTSLYQVVFDINRKMFKIINLKYQKDWNTERHASNHMRHPTKDEAFLTKSDFRAMLKKSGVGLHRTRLIKHSHLIDLHLQLFENE